ncbi:MAG: A/G-specific adenine glycosylase [Deltaproteobacteria bacterium]|nr:A/G-specific adenine glycosylase [Deltaproteobacteria bacterium]
MVAWYRQVQRDLPWRRTRDPYAIWVSEIMLQQTRVATVIPYWERWMARFPTVTALADAPADDVLAAWAGLGYYSRARNLHKGASEVARRWDGQLPSTASALRLVPGIGAYTAGAIASIAFGERAPLVDGNVLRVLARIFAVEDDVKKTAGQKRIWALAGELMTGLAPDAIPGELNQGLMELGATVCAPRAPTCDDCPVFGQCLARQAGRQAELPVLPARKGVAELARLDRFALWIEADGQVLLARRRPEGLFGGLWELPQADDAAAAAAAIGIALAAVGEPHHTHEQVLSHRRLRVRVATARVTPGARRASLGKVADPGYDAVSWHELERVATLGISTATAAILRQRLLDKDPRWTSIPTRSRSSAKATPRSSRASASSATTSTTPTSPAPRPARRKASTSSSTTRRR